MKHQIIPSRRTAAVFTLSLLLSSAASVSAFAGAWQQNEKGYWWQNNDGSYPTSRWVLLDGNSDGIAEYYYFDENGYLLTDTQTPDYRSVDQNGALLRHGQVVTRSVMKRSPTAGGKLKTQINPELPLSLLGQSVTEVQARYDSDLSLSDKADSLEYLSIAAFPDETFIARNGVIREIRTIPSEVLSDFTESDSLQRIKVQLHDAGMTVDSNDDFMLKAYYNGYELLFEYRDRAGVSDDSPVTISIDRP